MTVMIVMKVGHHAFWSGEETEDTLSWTLGYRVISPRNANTALVFKVLLFLGGKTTAWQRLPGQ